MSKSKLWIIVAVVAAMILAVGGSAYAATVSGQGGSGNGQVNQNRNAPVDAGENCANCGDQEQLTLRDGTGDNCDGTCDNDGVCDGTCDGEQVRTQTNSGATINDANGFGPQAAPGNQATVRTQQQNTTSTTGAVEQVRERAQVQEQVCDEDCEQNAYGPSDAGQNGANGTTGGNGNGDQQQTRLQDPQDPDCDGTGPSGAVSGPQGSQGRGVSGSGGYGGDCPYGN